MGAVEYDAGAEGRQATFTPRAAPRDRSTNVRGLCRYVACNYNASIHMLQWETVHTERNASGNLVADCGRHVRDPNFAGCVCAVL